MESVRREQPCTEGWTRAEIEIDHHADERDQGEQRQRAPAAAICVAMHGKTAEADDGVENRDRRTSPARRRVRSQPFCELPVGVLEDVADLEIERCASGPD